MGEHEKYSSGSPPVLLKFNHVLHQILPLVLILLFTYLGLSLLTEIDHYLLEVVELVILTYFVMEVVVAFLIYESFWTFLRDKWINILLIIPFFAAARVAAYFGHGIRSVFGIELAIASASESAVLSRLGARVPMLQKVGHGLLDSAKLLKKKKVLAKFVVVSAIFERKEKENPAVDEDENEK